jgi:cytidylate kinase
MAILTLSRKLGSGSQEIGDGVAKALNYDYITKKRILSAMKTVGERWEALGTSFDERSPGVIERNDSSYIGFVALAEHIVLQFALRDNVTITGRGANFTLKGVPYALRIRVTAPLEQRIERVMKRNDVRREVAAIIIQKADFEISRSVRYIYGKDWDDPAIYDAIVDTGTETIEQIVANLSNQLIQRDSFRTEEAKKQLALKAKAAHVRAGILTNPKLNMPVLEVQVRGEGLVVRGVAKSTDIAERVEEVALRIARDTPVRIDIYSRR